MGAQSEFFLPDDVSSEEAVRHWDAAAAEFAGHFAEGEEYYHKHIINPCVLDVLGNVEGKRVLDLACGEGHFARGLAERTNARVRITGVDASERMIRIAREKSEQFAGSISFQVADASQMPQFEADSFDVVVCNMALMDIAGYREAIEEVARVLKPAGAFVFSILHPCFCTPGSGWIRKDPESRAPENKIGWRVDNYHSRLVVRLRLKPSMSRSTYYFHRTLEDYFAALRDAGFVVTDLREPVPSKELIEQDPGAGPDLKVSSFLVLKSMLRAGPV